MMKAIDCPLQGGATNCEWRGLGKSDEDHEPASVPGFTESTIHVYGDFDGATVTLEGSNSRDRDDWQTLSSPDGYPLVFTSPGIKAIQENTLYYRPCVSGAPNSDISVIITMRRVK